MILPMFSLFASFLISRQYIPHGHCYLWQPELLWLHVLADALIALAYFSIPLSLIYFVRQREDVPFKGIFILFSLFILGCGTTHLMSIWTLWYPDYWVSGFIKAVTAVISVATAVAMIPTLPKALAMRSPKELEILNKSLELEVASRQKAEEALQKLNLELESKVEQRTEEYRESEQRFRSLFEAAPDFIYVLNLEGKIEQVNKSVIDNSGYSESELIDHPLAEFLSERSQLTCNQEFSELLAQGNSRHEMEFICQDSTVVTMDCSCSVVGDSQEGNAYILVLQRNISDRKRMENALLKTNQELRASNAELEKFAYLASHDLREPLRMVTSFTQLLAQRYAGQLDEDADQIIGFAVDGAARMEELIHDLLEYSRIGKENKSLEVVDEDVDCEEVLNIALNNLQIAIQESNVQIVRNPLPKVIGNQGQLNQLFQNLLENAIVYRNSEIQSVIEVGAQEQTENWLFWVKDNGIGISEQYQQQIFQIFQRLHTKQEYPGTGIGLAICYKIIGRHDGKIWVESAPGKGATFYFTLPKSTAHPNIIKNG